MTTERAEQRATLTDAERRTLARVAELLIPAAHDMPSAADVVTDDRLRFVLGARPDLLDPLRHALRDVRSEPRRDDRDDLPDDRDDRADRADRDDRDDDLAEDARARLDRLAADDPATLYALQLVIVGAYYTDHDVRERIGYPGQVAITVRSWEYPPYLEEGLIDAVVARGPVWRDPSTGRRAEATNVPMTYAERYAGTAGDAVPPEGESDGHDRA
jgi:hypothetical protein